RRAGGLGAPAHAAAGVASFAAPAVGPPGLAGGLPTAKIKKAKLDSGHPGILPPKKLSHVKDATGETSLRPRHRLRIHRRAPSSQLPPHESGHGARLRCPRRNG